MNPALDSRARFEAAMRDQFYGGLACPSDTWNGDHYTDFAHHMAWKAWQAAIASMAAEWISVDERLPEPGPVMFVVKTDPNGSHARLNGRVLGGLYLRGQGFSVPGICFDATHWQWPRDCRGTSTRSFRRCCGTRNCGPPPREIAMADAPTLDHADVERIRALLKDPVAVHLNMLHGHIAKIEMGMLAHVHGQAMQDRWAAFERWEAAQATPSPPVAAPPATPYKHVEPTCEDAALLWAEIHHLRAAVQGPEGFATWQEAATAERVRRVKAERAAQPQPAQPLTGAQMDAIDRHLIRAYTAGASGEDFDMLAAKADITTPTPRGCPMTILFETIRAAGGEGHYINDYRVGGAKPWAGGTVVHSAKLSASDVVKALADCKDGRKALEAWQPKSACGHPASLMLKSAETGAPLYCELCDAITGRRDAEAMEAELRQKLADLSAEVAP